MCWQSAGSNSAPRRCAVRTRTCMASRARNGLRGSPHKSRRISARPQKPPAKAGIGSLTVRRTESLTCDMWRTASYRIAFDALAQRFERAVRCVERQTDTRPLRGRAGERTALSAKSRRVSFLVEGVTPREWCPNERCDQADIQHPGKDRDNPDHHEHRSSGRTTRCPAPSNECKT